MKETDIGTPWLHVSNAPGEPTSEENIKQPLRFSDSGRVKRRISSTPEQGITGMRSWPAGKNVGDSVYSARESSWVTTWTLEALVHRERCYAMLRISHRGRVCISARELSCWFPSSVGRLSRARDFTSSYVVCFLITWWVHADLRADG